MRLLLNVIWFVLAGWWLIIGHLVTGVLLCLTIIGIPLGLANFKLIPVTLRPFGRDIVSIDEAERQGVEQQVTMPASAPKPELSGGARQRKLGSRRTQRTSASPGSSRGTERRVPV
jgi:hypothetical protein